MARKKRKSRKKKSTPAGELRILVLLLLAAGATLIMLAPFLGDQVGEGNNRMGSYGIQMAEQLARLSVGRYLIFLLPLALFHSLYRPRKKRNLIRFSGRYLLLALLGAILVASLVSLGAFTTAGIDPELHCGTLFYNFLQRVENATGWPGVLLLLIAAIGVALTVFTRVRVSQLVSLLGKGAVLAGRVLMKLLRLLGRGSGWLGQQLVKLVNVQRQKAQAAASKRRQQRVEQQEAIRIRKMAAKVATEKPTPTAVEPEADIPADDSDLTEVVQEEPEPEATVFSVSQEPPKASRQETAAVKDDTDTSEVQDPADAEFSVEDEFVEEEVPWEQKQRLFKREFVLPSVDLLQDVDETQVYHISQDEMQESARRLEEQLRSFNVEAHVVHVAPGPVITRYELELAPGVKVNSITNLADDLLIAMKTESLRIVPHIPGKAVVGVELPNPRRNTVYLRSVINTDKFSEGDSPLLLALGKTTSGEAFVADLRQMPHLLIAGRTGAGKSVCINSVIASILYRARPTEVQFVLIDPKMIELSDYQTIRDYYLCSLPGLKEEVVTRPDNAVHILNAVSEEMERRYLYLSRSGFRNIKEFNEAVDSGLLKEMNDGSRAERMVYIVVIIDELADLMLAVGRDIEAPIAKLAQKARAIGIHLIVATQRPSVDVVTGVIKANFPARISFAVRQKVDSRTILDMMGAEKLLGDGDMLYLGSHNPELIRVHGSLITGPEIRGILKHVRQQSRGFDKFQLQDIQLTSGELGGDAPDERDTLYEKALETVVRTQQGSISVLQRKMKIGYNRSARIIDQLEAAGIVGPADGSKPREVLVDADFLDSNLGDLDD
jgi:DNA segregation ATPase FtsK/SpoIIIE, S-DNA-T family